MRVQRLVLKNPRKSFFGLDMQIAVIFYVDKFIDSNE